jgi:hypothetical protein
MGASIFASPDVVDVPEMKDDSGFALPPNTIW